jgi:hypothetical protein
MEIIHVPAAASNRESRNNSPERPPAPHEFGPVREVIPPIIPDPEPDLSTSNTSMNEANDLSWNRIQQVRANEKSQKKSSITHFTIG